MDDFTACIHSKSDYGSETVNHRNLGLGFVWLFKYLKAFSKLFFLIIHNLAAK